MASSEIDNTNAFEALCELAAHENWCWNLVCGTCGHGVFRWGLRAIADGKHPADFDWPVHWGEQWTFDALERACGPMPPRRDWPRATQEALQAIVAGAVLSTIGQATRFPDWLGYIGLALNYTEDVERTDPKITRSYVPQLLTMVSRSSVAHDFLASMDSSRRLHPDDLGLVERSGVRSDEEL